MSESFAGGFSRTLEVDADGYETAYLDELRYEGAKVGDINVFREPKVHLIELRRRQQPIQSSQPTPGS